MLFPRKHCLFIVSRFRNLSLNAHRPPHSLIFLCSIVLTPSVEKPPASALQQQLDQEMSSASTSIHVNEYAEDDASPHAESQVASFESMLARADFSPSSWRFFFDERFDVYCSQRATTFRCFYNHAAKPPVLKDVVADAPDDDVISTQIPVIPTDRPIFVLFHGAGHTALSFAACAEQIRQASLCSVLPASLPTSSSSSSSNGYPVLAFDLRGHGGTRSDSADEEHAFSADSLVDDAVALLNAIFTPAHVLMLVGHSLGGALVVRVAALTAAANKYKPKLKPVPPASAAGLMASVSQNASLSASPSPDSSSSLPASSSPSEAPPRAVMGASLAAVVVMDVVEGTAMAALTHMRAIISARPARFPSLQKVPTHPHPRHRCAGMMQSSRKLMIVSA